MLQSIPTVSLTMDRRKFVRTIMEAFYDIGFVFVEDPVMTSVLPPTFRQFDEFFQLPSQVKAKYARPDIFYQRGWTPPLTEKAIACRGKGPGGTDLADAKEAWFMGPDFPHDHPLVQRYPQTYHPNIWPTETPGLRPWMERLHTVLLMTGASVLGAVGEALGKPPAYFDEMIAGAPTLMRAIHYPPVAADQVGNIVWGCMHTDINLVTVLPPSTGPGLWIRRRDGQWIPGQSPAHCVIAQVGDMLEYLTGGELMSAAHEVRAPDHPTDRGRLSAALFIHARGDVVLDCQGRGPDAAMCPPITADELLVKRLKAIGLA